MRRRNAERFSEAASENNKHRRRARTRTALLILLLLPFVYLPLLMEAYDALTFFFNDDESPYDNHGNWALSSYFGLPEEPTVDLEDITDFQKQCRGLLSKKFSKNKLYALTVSDSPEEGYSIFARYSIRTKRFFSQPLHGSASFGNRGVVLCASSIMIRRWARDDYFPPTGYYGRNIEYEITNELVDSYLAKIPEYTDNLKSFNLYFEPESIVLYVNELPAAQFKVPEG